MTRIAVYGGSFDCPHVGHLLVAAYALSVLDPDEFLVVPCYEHGNGKNLTSFEHRHAMTELAMSALSPKVFVTDIESKLRNRYTADLLLGLKERYPVNTEFTVIVGADVANQLPTWHRGNEVLAMAKIAVVARYGEQINDPSFRVLNAAVPNVESHVIRGLLQQGDIAAAAAVLPAKVLSYIQKHNLYGVEAQDVAA